MAVDLPPRALIARATAEHRWVQRRRDRHEECRITPRPVRDRVMVVRYLYDGYGATVIALRPTVIALRPTVMVLEVPERAQLVSVGIGR